MKRLRNGEFQLKIFGCGLPYFNTIRNSYTKHRDDVIIGDQHMRLFFFPGRQFGLCK